MADDFTNNDLTTGIIAVGGTATGEIEASFDRDWFAVNLLAGRVYRIEMRGADTLDGTQPDPYFGGVYDNGSTVYFGSDNNDANGSTTNSLSYFTAPYTGIYYLEAEAAFGTLGTYTLEVTDLIGTTTGTPPDDLILGTTGAETLEGFGGNDTIYGLDGGDLLEGGDQDDFLFGGFGSDTLYGGEGADRLNAIDNATSLTDLASVDYLFGGEGNDNLNGYGSHAFLYGEGGEDRLFGGPGNFNQYLDGGNGADVLIGQGGSDVYIVDNIGDFVSEYQYDSYGPGNTAIGDIDEIRSWIDWTLRQWNDDGFNVENLTLLGTADLSATGNEVNNVVTGNSGHNILNGMEGPDTIIGGAGNDTITGGTGDDTMTGGTGEDVFVFAPGDGNDTISDFTYGVDTFDLSAFGGSPTQVKTAAGNGDRIITVNGDVTIQLSGVPLNYAPEITSPEPGGATEEVLFSFTVTATDLDGDTIVYDAGGSTLPSWLTHQGGLTFSGTPVQADVGTTSITITVSDGQGGTDTQSFDLTVADVNDAPEITSAAPGGATQNTLYSFTLTTLDLDGDTVTFDAGASTLPLWLTHEGGLTFSGTPGQSDVAITSVTVAVSDGRGGSDVQTFDLTVADVNDAPEITSVAPIEATQGAVFSYVLMASDLDGDTVVLDAGASTLPSWLTHQGGLAFVGTPGQSDVATTSVTITVSDGRGGTDTQTFDLTVADVNDAPTGSIIVDGTASPGAVLTADTSGLEDADGLGALSYEWLRDDAPIDGANAANYTLTQADVGAQISVRVSYTDNAGTPESITSDATMAVANWINEGENYYADYILEEFGVSRSVAYSWDITSIVASGSAGALDFAFTANEDVDTVTVLMVELSATDDDLVEDDESLFFEVTGYIDYIGPVTSGGASFLNVLGQTVFGEIQRFEFTKTLSFNINSTPEGFTTPIEEFVFDAPGVIGNVLTNFTDGNGEGFSAIPTLFSGTVSGEIRLNGDIFISAANGSPGQFIEVAFTVIDNRGAITSSSQTITLAGFQDDYLPGDAATDFGSIAVDTTETGFIEMDGDRDRFDVTLQAGVLYNISLEGFPTLGGSLLDPQIFGLYDSLNGLVVNSIDDNSGVDTNALLSAFTVQSGGIYQIEVGSAGDVGAGDYLLSVASMGFIDDFLPGNSSGFGSVALGIPTMGEIETVGDIDGFMVSLEAGITYQIGVLGANSSGGTLSDPNLLGVFASGASQPEPFTANDNGGIGRDSLSTFRPALGGEYFIQVSGVGAEIGTYTVSIEELGFQDDLSDDLMTTGFIAVNGTATGNIQFAQDEDWFEVMLLAGRQYAIELRGAASLDGTLPDPVFVGVYNSTGEFLGAGNDNAEFDILNSRSTYTADYSGVHYLSAGGFAVEGFDTGTYTLEILDQGQTQPNVVAVEMLNEGEDITLLVDFDLPQAIMLPFPGTGSPHELIADRQLSFSTSTIVGVTDEDINFTYAFEDQHAVTFQALRDGLLEDDETIVVDIFGYIDWIVPDQSGPAILNMLGETVLGDIERTFVDFSLSITINSAPEGAPPVIEGFVFTGPQVIANLLTTFEDGEEEQFSALPLSIDTDGIVGTLLANGDLLFSQFNAPPGQSVVVNFTVEDARGAQTQSQQVITIGARPDDYLPGDTASVLGSIAVDSAETGSIEVAGDRDRFQVLLEAGQIYSIEMAETETLSGILDDPEIFGIYDSLNQLLPGSSDNDSGGNLDASVEIMIETSGLYEIEVGSHTTSGIGGYELTVDFLGIADDFLPGSFADALGAVEIDIPTMGNIETLGDRDRFEVMLQAGVVYDISLEGLPTNGGSLVNPQIIGLFDSLGALVTGTSDDDGGVDTNALVSRLAVASDGVYQIEVGSSSDFGIGDYSLTVDQLGLVDDFLPGPFAGTLGSVSVNTPITGVIEVNGDRDRFEVTLQAGIVYDISLEGSPTGGGSLTDPQIIGLFDSSGALVTGSSDNDGGTDANALVSGLTVATEGTYQIEVAGGQDVHVGDYTLTVESTGFVDDFLPGLSGAFGTVSIGGRVTGEIETSGDIDGFRVFFQANTTYEISILGRDSNNGTLVDPDLVGVFASGSLDGTPINSVQTLNTQFVGDDSTSYFSPQSAGEFFISVQGAFDSTGTYTVAVDNIGVRDDFAADIYTTGSIVSGGTALGRIDFTQDEDWFEVNLSANRLYEIELVPTASGNALADPFFRGVYDSNGVLIQNTENDDGGTGTSSALQFVTDDPGTFYLAAGGFGDATGQYRLELNDLGPLDDNRFNITIEFSSDNVPNDYVRAFEDAVERWEEIITGDLPYAFVEGYGFVDDILIEVAVENLELTFEGVEQNILAISGVLDQRSDSSSGSGALPTYSRIVINPKEVGTVLNPDELVANTIGRALGFGALWEEFGLVRDIDGVATYTGPNGLRELRDLSRHLNGVNALEDGDDGSLAAEHWREDVFGNELMTPLVALRTPADGQAQFGRPDNPISELTIAAMQDLGYEVNYGAADSYRVSLGALSARGAAVALERQAGHGSEAENASLAGQGAQERALLVAPQYIYERANAFSESNETITFTPQNTLFLNASATQCLFFAGLGAEVLLIELSGIFDNKVAESLAELSGRVTSIEIFDILGRALVSVGFPRTPMSVADVLADFPTGDFDIDNHISVDTVAGAVVRINPNGGSAQDSRIFAGAGNDTVEGGDESALIAGEAGTDLLRGNGGNDSLAGGRGDDTLDGGAGIDTAVFEGRQSTFTLTLSPTATIITDRSANGEGTDQLTSIEFLDFGTEVPLFEGNPMNLDIFDGPTGLTAAEFGAIIELYIAYYNRAPDALGLFYWGTEFSNGFSLPRMAENFYGQPETQATYASVLNEQGELDTSDPQKVIAFVTEVYGNVLGRGPDQPGLDYWSGELLGNPDITPDIFILAIIGGAKDPSEPTDQTDIDQAYLATKSDLGAYFSVIKGMSDIDDATAALALFDGSDTSRDATIAAIDGHYADALDPVTGDFLMPLVGVIDDPFGVV